MQRILPKLLFTLAIAVGLASCGGGGTGNSAAGVTLPAPNSPAVTGYWTPANPANPAYEFFTSPTYAPYDFAEQTGRVLRNGQQTQVFYWTIDTAGTITIVTVDPNCTTAPINLCVPTGGQTIIASGSTTQNSSWTVSTYATADGAPSGSFTDTYHRAAIDLSNLPQGQLFLTHQNNLVFDTPISGNVSGSSMTLRLDDFPTPITLKASGVDGSQNSVAFQADSSNSVTNNQQFMVTGQGYVSMPVQQWFENVSLSASANGGYALTYEMHQKVQVPSNINAALVQIGSAEAVQRISTLVSAVPPFVSGVSVQAPAKYFASLELNFQNANAGNQLQFTDADNGNVSYSVAETPGVPAESRNFTWVQQNDGTILMTIPGYGEVDLHFIQPIQGGYQVLYSKPDPNYGTTYRIRDLLYDGAPAVTAQSLPGQYTFTSISPLPNGSHTYNLTFHRDGSVSGEVGGYWFIDSNGDVVSYECTALDGHSINNYATCVAALNDTADYSFVHIRRAHFVAGDGLNFQSRYDGSVYGGQFTAQGAPVSTFELTYRWLRVGDEQAGSN